MLLDFCFVLTNGGTSVGEKEARACETGRSGARVARDAHGGMHGGTRTAFRVHTIHVQLTLEPRITTGKEFEENADGGIFEKQRRSERNKTYPLIFSCSHHNRTVSHWFVVPSVLNVQAPLTAVVES